MKNIWKKFSAILALQGILVGCGQMQVVSWQAASENAQELRAFQLSVYKLTRNHSCVKCHASVQAPFIASDDPVVAYKAILDSQKVNFQKPEISRLVLRSSQDKHNCGSSSECLALSKSMTEAIYSWRKSVGDLTQNVGVSTAFKPFREGGKINLPEGAFVFEAEEGRIVNSSTSASGNKHVVGLDSAAGKGKYLYVPEQGRTTPNGVLENFNDYAYAEYRFTATTESYRFYAKMMSPNLRFKFKLNNNAAVAGGTNSATWRWELLNGVGNAIKNQVNVLKVGEHDDGAKIDMIVAIPSSVTLPAFGNYAALHDYLERFTARKTTLVYDMQRILETPGVTLKVDASIFDESGYFFENPRLEGYPYNIQVQGVRVLQNGFFNAEDSDWVAINKVIMTQSAYEELDEESPNATQLDSCPLTKYNYLICNPMLGQRQSGPDTDSFAFGFELMKFTQDVPSLEDIVLQSSDEINSRNLLKTMCINCHANLDADDQTHYVINKAALDPINGSHTELEFDLTKSFLQTGTAMVNGKTVHSRAYDSGLNFERVVRPRVLDINGNVMPGSGGEGSLLYRILKYGEGPVVGSNGNGTIPDPMVPLRQALQIGTKGPVLVESIKNWIDTFPPVIDVEGPVVYNISATRTHFGALNSPATGQTKLSVKAIDDLTRVKAEVFVDDEATPYTLTTASLRALNGTLDWPPNAATQVDPALSHRFKVVGVDEGGNRSPANKTQTLDLGGCTLNMDSVLSTPGSITLGAAYSITAKAANRWADDADSTILDLLVNNNKVSTINASGTSEAGIFNYPLIFASAANHTISVKAMNQVDREAPLHLPRYNCDKERNITSSVSISSGGAPKLNQASTITVTFSSPYIVDVQNMGLSFRKINDPLSYTPTQSPIFETTSNAGKVVTATFNWTPDNINPHAFTASVSVIGNGQNTLFTGNATFTPTN